MNNKAWEALKTAIQDDIKTHNKIYETMKNQGADTGPYIEVGYITACENIIGLMDFIQEHPNTIN